MRKILFILLILAWISPGIRAQYVNADLGRPDVLWSPQVNEKLLKSNYVTKKRKLAIQRAMPSIPDKAAYAFLFDNADIPEHMGMISFQIPKPDVYTMLSTNDWEDVVWSGVFIEDTYYAYVCRINTASGAAFPKEIATFNLQTGEWKIVCKLDGPGAETISDFTYDYSTGTLYATKNTGMFQTTLYEYSLEDGSMTEVCTMRGTYIMAIACTYEGVLYGIGTGGGLYIINKENGNLTLVGNTGYMPWYLQSAEFDHTDNTLYWAGADAEHTFLATVDINTAAAVEIGTFEAGCNVTGLHIPFTRVQKGAPGAVTDFTVTPGQKGMLYAELSWKNPQIDPFGSILSGNMDVRVYRDGDMIAEMKGKQPGEECYYRDDEPAAGEREYRVIASNSVGTGETSKVIAWIGEDYPNEPQNISVEALNGTVNITWDVSETGAHGGFVNKTKLYSTVIREQDNTTVLDNEVAYATTDNNIAELNRWSYRVIVSDEAGNKAEAKSDTIVAGPGKELPYFEDFSKDENFKLWTVRNENNDTLYWKHTNFAYDKGARYLQYRRSYTDKADDYAIAPPVKMQAGHDYRISFDARINRMSLLTQEKLRLFVSKSPTTGAEMETVADFTLSEYDTNWSKREFVYSAKENGDYYAGIYIYSDANQNWANIDNFRIEELYYYDLEVTGLTGPNSALAGMNSTYTVTVKNKGSRNVDSYKVRLVDGEGNPLSEEVEAGALAANETASVSVTVNLKEVKEYTVYAEAIFDTDGNKGNNKTANPFVINVTQQGDYSIKIGASIGRVIYNFMQDWGAGQTWLQSVYTSSEINAQDGGLISKMEWFGGGFEIDPEFAVRIYLANTDKADLANASTIPTSEMTLVYDGTMNFDKAESNVLEFSQPFRYDGRNLAVHIERGNGASSRSTTGGLDVFGGQANASYCYYGFRGNNEQNKPVVKIYIDASGNSVSGTVNDTEGNPLEGVTVTIKENGISTASDEEGKYMFDLVNAGTYNFVYSLFGYSEKTEEITVSEENDTPVTKDITLEKLKQCDLTITVTDGKDAIAEAEVSLKGYDSRTGKTNESGQAVFEDLVCGEYEAEIKALDYQTLETSLTFDGEKAEESSELKLSPIAYPVDAFSFELATLPELTWHSPVRITERRYDDGVATTRAGGTPSADVPIVETAVFGIVEDNPGTIKSVSWYLVDTEGNKSRKVNLYVFNLNADGTPENTPAMEIHDIESTLNGWFSYTLDEPYSSDRSFFVALSCTDEYLGLGVDGTYYNEQGEYQWRQSKQYYSYDYHTQYYPAAIWYKGNFMIRLQMADSNPQSPNSIDLLEGYNVYRFLSSDRNNQESWEPVAEKIQTTSYSDTDFNTLPQGYYQYGVTAVWETAGESTPAVSEIAAKDMSTAVTLKFTTEVASETALDGTAITLESPDGNYRYSATLENGSKEHTFSDVSKGSYKLTIVNQRFETVIEEVKPDTEDAYTFSYTLKEKLTAPVNLTATESGESAGTYDLSWNFTSSIFEDFEGHDDFALNSPGETGWSYLDNDENKNTYGMIYTVEDGSQAQVIYGNWGARTAYIIFNPTATNPRCDQDGNINAYSGDKFLGSFASSQGRNDDYIISPELFFDSDFEFSFYARSYSDAYGTEQMMVGYSLTDIEPESFIWLNNGTSISVPAYYWSHYTYTIPAAAKYVTIRDVSYNTFLLMIDDIQIGSGESLPFRSFATNFEIYLDGEKVSETTGNTFSLTTGEGRHIIGVKAIYETGESATTEIVVGDYAAVGEIEGGDAVRYYDRKLWFNGTAEKIEVFTTTGLRIAAFAGAEGSVSLDNLQDGVYIASVVINGKNHIVKFIIG